MMDGLAAAQMLTLQVVIQSIGGRSQVTVGSSLDRARLVLESESDSSLGTECL